MNTLRCARCKRTLPVVAFGVNRSRPNGYQSYCLACRCQYARQRRRRGLDGWEPARYRRHPAMFKAHVYVARAVKAGVLVRPALCPICVTPGRKVEGHHPCGYSPRHRLTVEWMCRSCHHTLHHRQEG